MKRPQNTLPRSQHSIELEIPNLIALCFKGRVREVPNHQIQQTQAGSKKKPAFFGFLGLGGSSCQNAPQCMKQPIV